MFLLKNFTLDKSMSFLVAVYFLAIMCSNAILQLTSVLMLVGAIICLFNNNKSIRDNNIFKKIPNLLLYSICIFSISGLISTLLNIHELKLISDSIGEYRWVIQLFVLVFILNHLFKWSWIKKSHWFYVVAFVFSIYAIWQSVSGLDLISGKHYRLADYGGLFRSIGPFSTPLTLAYVYGILFFTIFPQLLVLKKSFSTRRKFFLITLCILLTTVVVLTQTRGAWLAFALTVFFTLFIYKPARNYFFISLVISPLFYFALPGQLQHRIRSIANVRTDTSNTGRFQIWKAHYNVFSKNKIIGVGMGNNVRQLPNEYKLMGVKKGKVMHAHNNVIQILSAQGLLGVIPYIIFNLIFFIMAVKLVNYGSSDGIVVIGLMSSAVQLYLLIGGMTEATFIDQEVNHPLVFTWAITLVTYIQHKFNDGQALLGKSGTV